MLPVQLARTKHNATTTGYLSKLNPAIRRCRCMTLLGNGVQTREPVASAILREKAWSHRPPDGLPLEKTKRGDRCRSTHMAWSQSLKKRVCWCRDCAPKARW